MVLLNLGGRPAYLQSVQRRTWECYTRQKKGNDNGIFSCIQDVIDAVLEFMKIFIYILLEKNLAGGCLIWCFLFRLLFFSSIPKHHPALHHFSSGGVYYWSEIRDHPVENVHVTSSQCWKYLYIIPVTYFQCPKYWYIGLLIKLYQEQISDSHGHFNYFKINGY